MSTPVLLRTVLDVDTVTDSEYVVSALNSICTLVAHPRREHGLVMSEVARSEHAMVLDVHFLYETRIVEDDLGPTQVIEVGKNRKPVTLIKNWRTTSL